MFCFDEEHNSSSILFVVDLGYCTVLSVRVLSALRGFDRCSSNIQVKNTGNLYLLPFGHTKYSKADFFKIQVTCIFLAVCGKYSDQSPKCGVMRCSRRNPATRQQVNSIFICLACEKNDSPLLSYMSRTVAAVPDTGHQFVHAHNITQSV